MKSRKLPIWVIVVSVAVYMFVLVVYIIMRVPQSEIEITGNIVDNNYNNYVSGGKMCRIGDKIYLNYEKNDFNYGCAEISNEGVQRLYWEFHIESGFFRENIYAYDNRLYRSKDSLEYFDFSTGEFIKTRITEGYLSNYCIKEDAIFFLKLDDDEDNNLMRKNAETEMILIKNVDDYYVIGNEILYYSEDRINVFNVITGENKYLFKSDIKVDNLMCENGYVLFRSFSEGWLNQEGSINICKYKLDGSEEIQVIYKGDVYGFNVYNNKVYVSSESGVTVYDLFSNEEQILYTGEALDSYIFDDMWVYIRISKSKVIRVSNDGEIVEKVI